MKVSSLFIIATFFFVASINCEPQVRPFLFTTSPSDSEDQKVTLHLDAGLGDGSLGFSDAPSADSRIGVEWNLNSRWTFLGNTSFGKDDSHTVLTGQIEGLYALRNNSEGKFRAAAGGGVRWERDGGNVLLLKFLGGWQAQQWRFDTNMTLEKASSPDRDPIDLIMSIGWSHRVTSMMYLGIEAVGQDLEGFWEPNEAEGGARILLGPSIHFAMEPWKAGIAGGYVFRPTVTDRSSAADRFFGTNRLAIQISIGREF
ncbi:hypothetical protein L0244_37020 [bacterium]|nr:hypothetical protein [bacterium]MCI0618613.1 hypothetical protein [bacterium]